MKVFKDYSAFYDLLYNEKDYKTEANYIHELIENDVPKAKSILNLGCGTGNHDFLLAEKGYEIKGIDLSEEMIHIANKKLSINKVKENLSFETGNARTLRVEKKFDVVISLFHVMSYQVKNEEINQVFETVNFHLKAGGIFIFDCWYGPGVLTDLPTVRHKVLENEALKIHRIANPVMHLDENYTDVNYTILVNNKKDQSSYEIKETHKMRYLFIPELETICSLKGFKLKHLKDNIFSNNWNALFVCQK